MCDEDLLIEDALLNAGMTTSMKPLSVADLQYDNQNAFDNLVFLMSRKQRLNLTFEIKDGKAIYTFDYEGRPNKIYLNDSITTYIINWLKSGVLKPIPDINNIEKNADETYCIRLIKVDRENGAVRYNSTMQEYKANYPYGSINYGKLPYSTIEMIAKINSI